MNATSNPISVKRIVDFKATIAQLYSEVAALEALNDRLVALAHRIVDSAHGNHDTVILPTECVDDMAQCLENIRAGLAAGQ